MFISLTLVSAFTREWPVTFSKIGFTCSCNDFAVSLASQRVVLVLHGWLGTRILIAVFATQGLFSFIEPVYRWDFTGNNV